MWYFLPGSLRIAAAARAPAERYIAAAAEGTMVMNRPAANIAAGHSPASHNATTASQPTSQVMPVLGTVWQTAKGSIDEYWWLTWNAASTRVALRQVIEGRLPHGRLNADSGTEDRSYSCIAADNRRRHRQTGADAVLPHVPPHGAPLR